MRNAMNAYLEKAPPAVASRSLKDLIAFNIEHADQEMPHFRQEIFQQSEDTAGKDGDTYQKLRSANRKRAADAIDKLLASRSLDALIAPSFGPAPTSDLVNGDHILGGASTLAAVAGYPHLTVPMGTVRGLPVGISFMGSAWSEGKLLALGYAYEQRTHHRRAPRFEPATERK